jgi:putative ABC transport system permease protein
VRLAPAEAMRPPAPGATAAPCSSASGIDEMGPALRMIVRNMERRPLRTALSITGVAAAVAIVVMGNFFRDAIDVVVDTPVQPRPARRRHAVDRRCHRRRRRATT